MASWKAVHDASRGGRVIGLKKIDLHSRICVDRWPRALRRRKKWVLNQGFNLEAVAICSIFALSVALSDGPAG